MPSKYLKEDRLADVLALIQVLALDRDAHRSEKGLREELQGDPKSASSWAEVGWEHPEFFRINKAKECAISLVSRHVTPIDEDHEQRMLPRGFIDTLLRIAVDLHDREVKRRDRKWQIFQAILSGFAGGALPYVAGWLTLVGSRLR